MRQPYVGFTLVLSGVLVTSTLAANRTVSYVESSSGLNQPTMEGGRTELEFGDVDADGHVDLVCVGDHGSPYINSPQHGVIFNLPKFIFRQYIFLLDYTSGYRNLSHIMKKSGYANIQNILFAKSYTRGEKH